MAGTPQLDASVLDRVLVNSSDLVVLVGRDGRLRFVSAASRRILGREPSEWVGRDVFELLHPDDTGLAAEALVTSADGGAGVKDPLVLRVRHSDGRWRHVEIVANNLTDDPHVQGLLINARDLTERLRAQEAAVRDRRRFEQVFERAPIGMALVGVDGRMTRANAALAAMSGRPAQELLTMGIFDLVVPADRYRALRHGRETLEGVHGDPIEVRILRPDGRLVWVRVTATVVHEEDGTPLHAIAHLEDVTEQRLLREELEHRARHDTLTEALNREGFRRQAERVAAAGATAGVVVVDLDGFKRVNDRLGHAAGDELLVAVTSRLRSSLKSTDAVARFGGDEFVLLVSPVDPDELLAVAERVRGALAEPFGLTDGPARITGSVGTAVVVPGAAVDEALALADAAAYRAKRAGGDAVMSGAPLPDASPAGPVGAG